MSAQPWRVSLHGGHSSAFCDHAYDSLEDLLEAAVAAGYHTFGVTEHAPRYDERFLYAEERRRGWTPDTLAELFEAYAAEVHRLADAFADRLVVLRAFECEVLPTGSYPKVMKRLRERHGFDYYVGSVHFVGEIPIDGPKEQFDEAVETAGGLEDLAVAYYDAVAEMCASLQPEVVGHLDLVRKNAPADADLETPKIRAAADRALEAVRECDGILDLNTAGWRKGLGGPYPAPWLVERAAAMGIGFCFGDDSHCVDDVGAGLDEARDYLLSNGVSEVTVLTRSGPPSTPVERRYVPLD